MTLRLIKPEPRHVAEWRCWRTDPVARRFMYLPAGDLDEWAAKLATAKSDLADRSGELYRWIAEVDGTPLGSVSLSYVDWDQLFCEVGYVMAPEARGKGHGKAMVAATLDLGFSSGIERIMAFICTDNPASIRLVESLGFCREGLLRRHAIIEGERRDHYLYAMLKEEWPTR
ncbi:MAG: GNAT family N-acetyltransferase [Alphaproteobacteria bacterium]|nr:GNAT family N-acetyltransferase [Alphaproteobacteria bacterium]